MGPGKVIAFRPGNVIAVGSANVILRCAVRK